MPFLPKLSPLQSRLAASLIASLTVIALYLVFSIPQFAYAAEVDSVRGEDHNQKRLLEWPVLEVDIEELELNEEAYEADFVGYDRGIIGRAPREDAPTPLINNRMDLTNVEQGVTMSYSFLNASVWGDLSAISTGLPPSPMIRNRSLDWDEGEGSVRDEIESMVEASEHAHDLKLKPRQSTDADYRTVYITVNACVQPQPITNTTTEPPPQLQLYVSLSADNTKPGPGKDLNSQQMIILEQGAGILKVNATSDVYIGLFGENTTAYKDVWSAQIAASIDAPYHYYNGTDPSLFLVDSDSSSALLITSNLTDQLPNSTVYQEWMSAAAPFTVFAFNEDVATLNGLQNSYCALQRNAQIGSTMATGTSNEVNTSITARGNKAPKQQFYIQHLTSGSKYHAVLAMDGNSTASGDGVVGGGGQVWPIMNFTTLSDGNCAVIFDLPFCDQTAYAVPGNPANFANFTSLAAFYDNATQFNYQFFDNALAQIPCETTSSAQYSLARNCSDCAAAYKEWLCSVTIPRCTDFSSDLPWLQERNLGQAFPNGTFLSEDIRSWANTTNALNGSRYAAVDEIVAPGPYKEILPCDNLCHSIQQSCPASMGFVCPRPGRIGFNLSYGQMPNPAIPEQSGQVTCNYPGAAFGISEGTGLRSPSIVVVVALVVMSIMFI